MKAKTDKNQPLKYFDSISELVKVLGASKPLHPLITLVNHDEITTGSQAANMVNAFYMVSYKTNLKGKLKYGQGFYDFDEGGLIFVAPNQALSAVDENDECKGLSLFFHPDFFKGYPIAQNIKKYGFFSYNINEALHLSEKEKAKVMEIFEDIRQELNSPIDEISQDLVISYIEVLLNYSNRYYKRQFITRKIVNSDIVSKFEELLLNYFSSQELTMKGLPSVKFFSDKLNLSAGYLSDMLRSSTGLNAQQHIHAALIEKAKEKLTTTALTTSEIAYDLGFEHPTSFTKLFKLKTSLTPSEYRRSLN